ASALSMGSGTPITPVEATKTSEGWQSIAAAVRAAIASTAARPRWPVKALELPALTTSARALPSTSALRHHSTSGLGHLLVVNTPATLVPSGTVTKVMSQRSQFLYRARATRSVTPSIAGRAGKGWARGEVAVLMRASYIAQHGSGASASGGLTDAGSTGLMRSAGEWAGR